MDVIVVSAMMYPSDAVPMPQLVNMTNAVSRARSEGEKLDRGHILLSQKCEKEKHRGSSHKTLRTQVLWL